MSPQGTEMHFPGVERAGLIKKRHTIQIFEGRFNVVTYGSMPEKSPSILSSPKLLVFSRVTSLGHVVDVIADAKHMIYFVLATQPYRKKCIALWQIVFHCVPLFKNRVVGKV